MSLEEKTGFPKILFSVGFSVEDVLSESQRVSLTPYSECVDDGNSQVYQAGYLLESTIKVKPTDSVIPITTLKFKGATGVRSGDLIRALVTRYNLVETLSRKELAERPTWNQEETAIEIVTYENFNKVLRTDRSIAYSLFKQFIKI